MKIKKLSLREKQVVNCLRQGLNNKQIAVKLGLSEKSISTYKRRMKIKMGLEMESNDYLVVASYLKMQYPAND